MNIVDAGEKKITVAGREFNILSNVPQEYTAFVDAISELFYYAGSRTLCGACFQHKLRYGTSNGCCGGCLNLSTEGCVQKPIGCALWTCTMIEDLLPPRILRFLNGNYKKRNGWHNRDWNLWSWLSRRGIPMSCFRIQGFDIPCSAKMRRTFVVATKRVHRVLEWQRKQKWQPNWAKMEKLTHANPGTFTNSDQAGAASGSTRPKRSIPGAAPAGLRSSVEQCST